MLKSLVGIILAAAAVILPASAAFAPSPVAMAVERQRAIGYVPCTPKVSPLPSDVEAQGVAADADNGIESGTCEIRIAASLTDDILDTVVWHEVCHLSTIEDIARSGDVAQYGSDWAHTHPLFKQCVRFGPANTLGY